MKEWSGLEWREREWEMGRMMGRVGRRKEFTPS